MQLNPVPTLPAELVEGALLLPDRDAILPLLPRRGTVVEVGVGVGGFSRQLIERCRPVQFVAIDNFRLHELPAFWGRPPAEYFGGKTHGAWFRDAFAAEIDAGRMQVLEGDSAEQMERLADASVDVFYIDADHTYPAVKRDLDVAVRKVRPDGWLVLNDYVLVDQLGASEPYGVIYAAHEFMLQHRWAMQYFALQASMYCDVVLRRADLVCNAAARQAALVAENAALRREIAALRNSTSWRVSAPMRAVGRLLGRS